MLFDLAEGGHHAGYIQHLVEYWCKQRLPGRLDIVVSPKLRQQCSDAANVALNYGCNNINFVEISQAEVAVLSAKKNKISIFRAFQEWHLLGKYSTSLGSTHCLLMYFDTIQLPIALGKKPPCPLSGIYFRPTFHYKNFATYIPSWQDHLQHRREKLLISRVLAHPQFEILFCLDLFVVNHVELFPGQAKALYLPDPVKIWDGGESKLEQLRADLGIESDRSVFLLFGELTARKGIHQLLEAISLLPSELSQKLCLLLIGRIGPKARLQVESRIAQLSQSSSVQIITQDQFIPDHKIQPYFYIADVVLAPYQRHIGMSGILVRAAASQTPVLSSNYGLMGEITRRYQLGLTVDSTRPEEIAKGITQFLIDSPTNYGDRAKMRSFAEQNSADQFANVIFQHLLQQA
jgi:glycosyltransferase involved in cell wall biosynthesis